MLRDSCYLLYFISVSCTLLLSCHVSVNVCVISFRHLVYDVMKVLRFHVALFCLCAYVYLCCRLVAFIVYLCSAVLRVVSLFCYVRFVFVLLCACVVLCFMFVFLCVAVPLVTLVIYMFLFACRLSRCSVDWFHLFPSIVLVVSVPSSLSCSSCFWRASFFFSGSFVSYYDILLF